MLRHLPDDTGMAFVLIQHLDPKHESHLTELLSKASKMPVSEVKGETRVQANHVYVIPPRCNLGISDGVLHTPPRPASGCNMPVDAFLRDLAADRGSKALGVVLSGTASDGTLGLQAIKAAGGITFAQDVQTAKFDGMPKSAIAAGVVDYVLPPAGIALQLVAIARDAQVPVEPPEATDPPEDAELAKILRLVRTATGVDFTHYKHGTLARRIKRRMALRGFETLEDYSRDLEQNREEATALCENCFITVTAFFREPAVFEELKRVVFPALVEESGARGSHPDLGARVRHGRGGLFHRHLPDGIPGRGEGELSDRDFRHRSQRNRHRKSPRRHVRGRRVGACLAAAVGALLHPKRNAGTRLRKSIRDICVFARHNLAQDPPFSKLDLISCCNVLIYLGDVLQRKVWSILHYALKPAGLPGARSVGKYRHAFRAHFIRWRRPTRSIACGRPRVRRRYR